MKNAAPLTVSPVILTQTMLAMVAILGGMVSSCAPKLPPFKPPAHAARNLVQNPSIKIHNDYHQEMVFGVDGTQRRVVTVPPRSTMVIELKEGVYRYAAAAKGTAPVTGFKQFYRNHRYDLKFGVGQGRAD